MIGYILRVCRAAETFRRAKGELAYRQAVATRAGTTRELSSKIRGLRRRVVRARMSLHELVRPGR
jgi:hypothetical protein